MYFLYVVYFLSTEEHKCIIDLVFVVDASGSVRNDWRIQMKFLVDVAKKINMGPNGTHVGLVYFGNQATKVFDFKEFYKKPYDEQAILNKMTSIPTPLASERTFINRGLRAANRNIFRTRFGMRPNVKKVFQFN